MLAIDFLNISDSKCLVAQTGFFQSTMAQLLLLKVTLPIQARLQFVVAIVVHKNEKEGA